MAELYADVEEQNKLAVVMHDARLDSMDRRLHAQGLVILCLIIVIAAIIFVLVSLQYRFSQMEGRGMDTIHVVPLGQSAPNYPRPGAATSYTDSGFPVESPAWPPLVTFERVGRRETA